MLEIEFREGSGVNDITDVGRRDARNRVMSQVNTGQDGVLLEAGQQGLCALVVQAALINAEIKDTGGFVTLYGTCL